MEFSWVKNSLIVLAIITVLAAGISFALQGGEKYFTKQSAAVASAQTATTTVQSDKSQVLLPPPPPQKLSNPPATVEAVYVTGWSAGTKSYRNYLTDLFKKTEINAVVVDVKGSSGYVTYSSDAPDVKKYNLSGGEISDIDSFVRFLHDQNIYVIGRIAVFEDPVFAKARPELAVYNKAKTTDLSKPVLWQDNNGLSWMDPASKDVWDYNISLAKDAFSHGFDEMNFDYVRFPSDGKTGNMGFPVWDGKESKSQVITDFFQYIRSNLPNEKISADLFGQTTVNTDDMGIGQVIENTFANFDYVAPMVYPSHYINGFIGFANPADHPYEVIKYSMDKANVREVAYSQVQIVKSSEAVGSPAALSSDLINNSPKILLSKFRPWIQDFNMGAVYNAAMVEQEIKAVKDSLGTNFEGFMLWNASNVYTEGAIQK